MNKFLRQKLFMQESDHFYCGAYGDGFRDAVALLWPCVAELKRNCDLASNVGVVDLASAFEALKSIGEHSNDTTE